MTRYTYDIMEEYVKKMYHSIGIYWPHQLDMESIAACLCTTLVYPPYCSMTVGNAILIDDRLTEYEQWQDFGHELCHIEWHDGNQPVPPLLICNTKNLMHLISLIMLVYRHSLERIDLSTNQRKAVWLLQKTFRDNREFAEKRLELYVNNCR